MFVEHVCLILGGLVHRGPIQGEGLCIADPGPRCWFGIVILCVHPRFVGCSPADGGGEFLLGDS